MALPIKKYRRLLSKLDAPTPPADLAHRTILAIAARERKILMAKCAGLAALFMASIAVVITELTATGTQLAQSGFFQFTSLFFSDFSTAIGNFPDILLSLVESFPMLSAGLAIGGLVVAIWSCVGLIEDTTIMRSRAWLVK